MLKRIWLVFKRHKKTSFVVLLILVALAYFLFRHFHTNSTTVSYVNSTVTKGTLVSTISGTGQVSASNQVDLKPSVSGEVLKVAMVNGQEVQAGVILAQLDATEAYKSVRDAESNLASAKLSLEKLQQPADELSILQAENSLSQAQESKQNTIDDLEKAYNDGFSSISNAFLDLPTIISGLDSILYTFNSFNNNQNNINYYADAVKPYDESVELYHKSAEEDYQLARSAFDQSFTDYKTLTRSSDKGDIEAMLSETYQTAKNMSEAVKSANNLIQFYKDKLTEHGLRSQSLADTHLTSLNSYTSKINTQISSLFSSQNTIESDKEAITNADRSIAEKTASLTNLKAGADALDVQSQELSIQQKVNTLQDAREKLADYTIRAPFAGIIANLAVAKGETVGSSTVLASLLTKQKIAEVSLNEVDVAQVKVGQKATLGFDAVEGLSVTGEVIDLDIIGTVSQGVVSYNVKIGFDVDDERVKPGMSTSVNIITDSKQDVLLVPTTAIKTSGSSSYVEVLVNGQPQRKTVTTGLSNDENIEITSGLTEGEQIITQTISSQTKTTSSSQSNSSRNSIQGFMGPTR